MSVPVDVAELEERVAEYGPAAFLVSVGEHGAPHVVSVPVTTRDGILSCPAGRTTAANVARSGGATLLWPAPPGGDYCLIVDGRASVDEDASVAVQPVRAVLHRVAGAPSDLASCITVVDRRGDRAG